MVQTHFPSKNKIEFVPIKNNLNKGKMNPNNMIETINGEDEGAVGGSFLGVTIDTENGPTNPKIKKALDQGFRLLNILEFIQITKFKLNMTMFDYFWQVMVGGVTGTLMSTSVLQWFGYEGDYKKQRQNFKKMLKNNNISYRELTQQDEEIGQYPTIQEELQLLPSNVKHSKFLIMEPNDFKMAIMQLKTKNGHKIRQYYIDLEELLKMYVEYTLYFNHREATRKITNLEQMMARMDLKLETQEEERKKDREINRRLEESNKRQEEYMRSMGITLEDVRDQNEELLGETKGLKKQNKKIQRKLGIAVEDRAPLPDDKGKQERFVLLKRNDHEYAPYYTIRAQNTYTKRKIKVFRTLFPNLEILLDFKANPNSKTLYVRIKDELKVKGVLFEGNNINLEDSSITEEDLIEEMEVINDSKRDV
jgi:hypothetical protein